MYNRYIRNDSGNYSRVVQKEEQNIPRQTFSSPSGRKDDISPPAAAETFPPPHFEKEKERRPSQPTRPTELKFLDRLLSRFHLSDIDSGDLIILLLLFLLFHEDGDEELMIALGLLLIL